MNTPEQLRKNVSFGPINKSTIGLLKIIHFELLPVHYAEAIYEMIKDGAKARGELAFLYGDTAVGEVCFRIEDSDGVRRLYLMTIGVLPSYQRLGIGKMLLDHAIEEAKKIAPIHDIYLHVSVDNSTAMTFYERLGFTQVELVKEYYRSLDNRDAYLYSKVIE
jgi:ribosomal protein S18 acetylase RimI-like enzyme